MSETTRVWVSATQPARARASGYGEHSTGAAQGDVQHGSGAVAQDLACAAGGPAHRQRCCGRVLSRVEAISRAGSRNRPHPRHPPDRRARAERERGRSGGHRCCECEGDADDEQNAEAADHRDRGQQQDEEAGGGCERGGCDGGRAGAGCSRDRVDALCACRLLLLDAALELDRVVDGEADQHRQDGDRGHREAGAGECHRAERHARGGERDQQRQQPQARAEQQQQGERHRRDGDDQQHRDPVGQAVRERVGHGGHAGDDVGAAVSGI